MVLGNELKVPSQSNHEIKGDTMKHYKQNNEVLHSLHFGLIISLNGIF